MARTREKAEWAGIDAGIVPILERARSALHKIFIKTEAELEARGFRAALDRTHRLPITRLEFEDCTYVVSRLSTVPKEKLSRRQREVASLFLEGLPMKLIAKKLGISPRTVKFHVDNLFSKLGVNSRTEAAIIALRQGWADGQVAPPPKSRKNSRRLDFRSVTGARSPGRREPRARGPRAARG